jgi:hypothetical protein
MMAKGLVRAAMLGALLTGCAAEESELAELRIGLSGGSSTGGGSFGDSGGAGTTGTGGGSSSTGEPVCGSCGGDDCPGGQPLPPECTPIWGTSPGDAQALWCHEDNTTDIPQWMCDIGVDPMLPPGVCDTIEHSCDGPDMTIDQKLYCAAQLIDAALGGTNDPEDPVFGEDPVCQNHAAALQECLDQMGIESDLAAVLGVHMWNHVPVDDDGDGTPDRIIIIDPYSGEGIYIECPPEVVPLPAPL